MRARCTLPWQNFIRKQYPDWTEGSYARLEDPPCFRMKHVQEVAAAEPGELSDLERRLLSSLEKDSLIAEEVIGEYEGKLSFGNRMADPIACFGGSG